MAQNTLLAPGTTAATSTDEVVAAGSQVTVGLYVSTGALPVDAQAVIYIDTPGLDSREVNLDNAKRTTVVAGPCTFRLFRDQCGTAFGIYSED